MPYKTVDLEYIRTDHNSSMKPSWSRMYFRFNGIEEHLDFTGNDRQLTEDLERLFNKVLAR